MKKKNETIKNILITISLLLVCIILCLLIHYQFSGNALIPSIFMFGVFMTSVLTKGYMYGIISSVSSVLFINYAFTYPYFKISFVMPENILSTILLIAIALITSMLTSKLKEQDVIKSVLDKQKTRANLLRTVSHDFRTPLTTIYGSSSAMLEAKNLTEEQKEKMLRGIQQDSLWLFRMAENLISITMIDSGNIKMTKIPTLIDELVDSVIIKLHKRYPNQIVYIDIPDGCVAVSMDAILIEQVLINLLENAVQHAKGMSKLQLKIYIKGNDAIFEIEDDGCGIPNGKLKSIFEGNYNNAPVSSDSTRSNTGIGLAACTAIIKVHGSELTAKNKKNGGTIFRFALSVEADSNDTK